MSISFNQIKCLTDRKPIRFYSHSSHSFMWTDQVSNPGNHEICYVVTEAPLTYILQVIINKIRSQIVWAYNDLEAPGKKKKSLPKYWAALLPNSDQMIGMEIKGERVESLRGSLEEIYIFAWGWIPKHNAKHMFLQ